MHNFVITAEIQSNHLWCVIRVSNILNNPVCLILQNNKQKLFVIPIIKLVESRNKII